MQDCLGFRNQVKVIQYKFISPLNGVISVAHTGEQWDTLDDELLDYKDEITKACREYLDEPTGLAKYIWENEGEIHDKVKDIQITVEIIKGKLMGVAYVKSEQLSAQGVDALKGYLEGQYSDGWGEGFEQHPVTEWRDTVDYEEYDEERDEYYTESAYTKFELYVSFWFYGKSWKPWKLELDSQKNI